MVKQGGASGRLPTEYQEVEWVGVRNSTTRPTAYIGIDQNVLTTNRTLQAEFKPFSIIGAYDSPIGRTAGGAAGAAAVFEVYYSQNGTVLNKYGKVSTFSYKIGTWDSVSVRLIVSSGLNLLTYSPSEYAFNGKLKSASITDDSDGLVHDFVPCYRKADGAIGVYDIVGNTFHTNSGTGALVKGNDV